MRASRPTSSSYNILSDPAYFKAWRIFFGSSGIIEIFLYEYWIRRKTFNIGLFLKLHSFSLNTASFLELYLKFDRGFSSFYSSLRNWPLTKIGVFFWKKVTGEKSPLSPNVPPGLTLSSDGQLLAKVSISKESLLVVLLVKRLTLLYSCTEIHRRNWCTCTFRNSGHILDFLKFWWWLKYSDRTTLRVLL